VMQIYIEITLSGRSYRIIQCLGLYYTIGPSINPGYNGHFPQLCLPSDIFFVFSVNQSQFIMTTKDTCDGLLQFGQNNIFWINNA